MKRVALALFALLVTSIAAQANTLTLNQVLGNLYQQTIQNPCIFSNPSCKNGTFQTTDLPLGGNVDSYDEFSPIYAGSELLAIMGSDPLRLGIDINEAKGRGPQTLTAFYMLVNGSVVDTFTGTPGNVLATNNGNGYADYLLTNFSSFNAADTVQFHFVFDDANDGTENVFIVKGGDAGLVPEPSSLVTMAFGLILATLASRKVGRSSRRP